MKLATLKQGGRDGTLVVVSRDLKRCRAVPAIARTMLAAMDDWATVEAQLRQVYEALNSGAIEGEAFDLNRWRQQHPGQAGLIYFWSEWCGICRTTAGSVASLAADWPVITVAMQSGPPAKVAETMRERDYRWPTLADPEADIFRQYGFRGVPAFVVIDPSGEIRSISLGYTSEIGLRLRLWWASRIAA